MLVKHEEEKKFPEPKVPKKDAAPNEMEKYKIKMQIAHREDNQCKKDKGTLFGVIKSRCSHVVKSKLENDPGFKTLEQNNDAIGLLDKIEDLAFGGGVQNVCWATQHVLKRLTGVTQGQTEALTNYYRRFLSCVKVVEKRWGQGEFVPLGLIDGTVTDAKKKEARDRLLATMFLAGTDKNRHGKVQDDLSNSCLGGTDKCPTNVDDMLTLLQEYQDHNQGGRRNTRNNDMDEGLGTTSFVQRGRRRGGANGPCWNCGEHGHVQRNCPNRNRSGAARNNAQREDNSSDGNESVNDTRTGISWSPGACLRRWSGIESA